MFITTQNQVILRLIALSTKVKETRKNFLDNLPHHINVISIAARGNLKETAHSAILQQILLHPFILNSFLKNIAEIENSDFTTDQVRPAEAERMDVSIYGKDRCVIIENKVNGAGEQEGQIFRYVQQAMEHKEHHYRPDNIHVIYLNPDDHGYPSVYSLTENGSGKNWIPSLVKEQIRVKDYSHDIYEWIKSLQQEECLADQPFLLSALYQYQDYLEEKFELTDKFEPMKNNIKELIDKEVLRGLSDEEDKDLSMRIKLLKETKQELAQLQSSLDEYLRELNFAKFRNEMYMELGLTLIDMDKEYSFTESNFGFKINLNGKSGFVTYATVSKYIGFAFDTSNLTNEEKSYLIKLFMEFGMTNNRVESRYPCWNYVVPKNYDTLIEKYIGFAKFIIKKVEEPQEEGMKLKIVR